MRFLQTSTWASLLLIISTHSLPGMGNEFSCKKIGLNPTQERVETYDQTHFRSLAVYEHYLPEQTKSFLETPGLKTLDVGAGYGLAGLQLTSRLNRKSTVINVQNFWDHLKKQINLPGPLKIENKIFSGEKIPSVNGIAIVLLSNFLKAVEGNNQTNSIDLKRNFQQNPEFTIQRINIALKRLETLNGFKFLQGYAEEVLPRLDSNFNLIIDMYGAFFYSPKRNQLLKEYWNKLEPGGEIVIALGDIVKPDLSNFYSVVDFSTAPLFKDRVVSKGVRMPYMEWLVDNFNGNASLETSRDKTLAYLRIEKPYFQSKELKFLDRLSMKREPQYSGDGKESSYHYPILIYKEK